MPKKKPWTVYLLRCKDGSLYTGITTDLRRRLAQHNDGTGAKYTRSRRPVAIAWKWTRQTESSARKREAAIKQLTREEKLDLIRKKRTRRA